MKSLTREQIAEAIERSERCADCDAELTAAVYRLPVVVNDRSHPIAPFCRKCADERRPAGQAWIVKPCDQCGRDVARTKIAGHFTFCSAECHRRLRVADRRETRPRVVARKPLECEVCGKPFIQRHRRQTTHGGACKKALERQPPEKAPATKGMVRPTPTGVRRCECDRPWAEREDGGERRCRKCGHGLYGSDFQELLEREQSRQALAESRAA